jgi:competence protein ComEA
MKKVAILIFFLSLFVSCFAFFGKIRNFQDFILSPKSEQIKSYKINLNLASSREFENLPRIGPALAKRIIDYRTKIGGYKSTEEIRDVKGIGNATFKEIKEFLEI